MTDSLRVLVTNICLTGRTGTEIATRNIALELLRQGHVPSVFTLDDGPIGDELRRASIPVTTDITTLRGPFDVIHGHHNPTTAIAATRFPDIPAIFVCHDFTAWHDVPPKLANIRRYVAVDRAVEDRLTQEAGIPPDGVQVILNAVDMRRFKPGPPLPASPARAVFFAKQQSPIREVTAACDLLGLSLDVVGPVVDNVIDSPEQLMLQYDLVFASAMTALEALACGRPVVVCGGTGLAGLVTRSNFDQWRPLNFGRRTLKRPLDRTLLIDEIRTYDGDDATELMHRVRNEADVTSQVSSYLACYREVIAQQRGRATNYQHHFQMLSEHLQFWAPRPGPAWAWMAERSMLIDQLKTAQLERRPVRLDELISFSTDGNASQYVIMQGLSYPEVWGTWTNDDTASLRLELREPAMHGVVIDLVVMPFTPDRHPTIQVDATVNGRPVELRTYDRENMGVPQQWLIELPKLSGTLIWLDLNMRSPVSPRELGMSEDGRRLGLGLVSLVVRPGDRPDGETPMGTEGGAPLRRSTQSRFSRWFARRAVC